MSATTRRFTVFAEHHQFCLRDAQADLPQLWDERSVADMITTGPGAIGVGTPAEVRHVPVTVRMLGSEPEDENLDPWDHVTEAGLSLASGCLLVHGPMEPGGAERIEVEPGEYGVRIYCANLGSVSRNGLEGDDSYEVALWPGAYEGEPRVLKRSDWAKRRL